jgi:flagellar biosynthesis/type III secretory pathway M-ring protein FliF/YscJ
MNVDFPSGDGQYSLEATNNRTLTSVQALAQTEPELAEALSAMGIESIDESVDVEAIRQKIDLPLEQIKKMAKQKPQAVAMLMKSWLLEERR